MALGTAGGPPKRGLLRGLGVETALGSRDTAFVEDLVACCGASCLPDRGLTGTSPLIMSDRTVLRVDHPYLIQGHSNHPSPPHSAQVWMLSLTH